MAPPPPPHFSPLFLLALLFFFSTLPPLPSAARHHPTTMTATSSVIAAACARSRYPPLCVATLSSAPLPATTPADFARAAVSVSLGTARNASAFLTGLPSPAPGAIKDCREQLRDSADQLAKTGSELGRLRPETFRWQLDNALTWASAAMTNVDTCLDGVKQKGGSGVAAPTARAEVVSRVSGVSRVTSNALYFINRLALTKGRGV